MIVYELFVVLGWLVFTPKLLFQKWFLGKSIPSFLDRIGLPLPSTQNKAVFWIHAVSLGEMKAARSLCKKIKQETPEAYLFLTTSTATGKREAEQIAEADCVRYLPLDLSWVQHAWAKRLRPKLFLLIEGDVWYNLLKAVKKNGAKTVLVSGKLSERSQKRYSYVPWIARKLYQQFDLLLVQNTEHAERFTQIIGKAPLSITGNLKWAQEVCPVEPLSFPTSLPIVALTCTHSPEEEELLPILYSLPIFLVLAPRHPERFTKVAQLLIEKKIPFLRHSVPNQPWRGERVFLLDAMGKLPGLYQACSVAILGGSFSSKIGGHNPLEPLFQGAFVLFGPFMHLQKELAASALETGRAKQVNAEELPKAIHAWISQPEKKAFLLAEKGIQILQKSWVEIQNLNLS